MIKVPLNVALIGNLLDYDEALECLMEATRQIKIEANLEWLRGEEEDRINRQSASSLFTILNKPEVE